jgi:hypothetical protein
MGTTLVLVPSAWPACRALATAAAGSRRGEPAVRGRGQRCRRVRERASARPLCRVRPLGDAGRQPRRPAGTRDRTTRPRRGDTPPGDVPRARRPPRLAVGRVCPSSRLSAGVAIPAQPTAVASTLPVSSSGPRSHHDMASTVHRAPHLSGQNRSGSQVRVAVVSAPATTAGGLNTSRHNILLPAQTLFTSQPANCVAVPARPAARCCPAR